ncbi:AAA family ATPase [Thermodesulfobacteriota bacterium]
MKGTEELPFYLPFSQAKDFYTPICLVGLNGSGKSNLIELISDTLCYADRYYNDYYKSPKDLPYNFELKYALNIEGQQTLIKLKCQNNQLTLQHYDGDVWHSPLVPNKYLPENIVAYSSGLNQGLSSIFAKNQYHFYDVVRKQGNFHKKYQKLFGQIEGRDTDQDEKIYSAISEFMADAFKKDPSIFHDPDNYNPDFEPNIRLDTIQPNLPLGLFSDHYANQLIFISLYVTTNPTFRDFLTDKLNINRLVSFELDLRLNEYKTVDFVEEEVRRLVELSSKSEKFNISTLNGILEFKIDKKFYDTLEGLFASRDRFFEMLLFFTYLSAKKWSPDEQKSLKTAKYLKNVPHTSGGYAPIRVVNTKIKLNNPDVETLYDRLSDGEHQLIQIIAALIMFEDKNTLFILDEPESHFNPEWRSEFVSLVNQYVNTEMSEVVVSTHSPFLVSSCLGNRVLHCKKEGDKIEIERVEVETYGASFDTLLRSVFDLPVLISREPWSKIKELSQNRDKEWVVEELGKFGDSFEINFLKNKIRRTP